MISTHRRGEIAVLSSDILKLSGNRIEDLHVACEISVAIDFGELVECLVCNLGNV